VIPAAYLGKDYRQVQAELAALGLAVTVVPQESIEDAPGRVIELNPVGAVPVGSPITVIYAVAPQTSAPTTSSVPPPSPTTTAVAAPPTTQSTLPSCTDDQLPGLPPTCAP
jgi:serine/threonine-protein kinase